MKSKYIFMFTITLVIAIFVYTQFFQFRFETPYQSQFEYKAIESGQIKLKFQLKPPESTGEIADSNLFVNLTVIVN